MTAVIPATRLRLQFARSGVVPLVLGVALFAICALLIDRHHVDAPERVVFRAVNDHGVAPFAVVWPIMQLGNFIVIPVAVAMAAAFRRWWLALQLLVGGLSAYLLAADVVRRVVVRGRPASLLPDVHIRGATPQGLGFVSGHVAVATTLAVLALPYLGRLGRVLVLLAAGLVGLARMYVGAHLPLDVIGGVGLGLAVAGTVQLLVATVHHVQQRSRS